MISITRCTYINASEDCVMNKTIPCNLMLHVDTDSNHYFEDTIITMPLHVKN